MYESSALVLRSVPEPMFRLLIAPTTANHEIFTLNVAKIAAGALIIRVERGMICGKL